MRNARASEDKSESGGDGTVETIEKVYGDKKAVADVVESAMNIA